MVDQIKILLVDDHPLIRSGLAHTINAEEDLTVCGEAESVDTALAAVDADFPDIVIADISLEKSNGIDLIKILKGKFPSLPVLVVSVHDEPKYVESAFQSGAKGYLLKRESVNKVTTAIRQVLNGQIYASESLLQTIFSPTPKSPTENSYSKVLLLSKRESEIFKMLGEGKSRKEIAAQLNISLKTVESHIDKMKPKLDVNSGFELIHFAIRHHLSTSELK